MAESDGLKVIQDADVLISEESDANLPKNTHPSNSWLNTFIKIFVVYSFVNFGIKFYVNRVTDAQENQETQPPTTQRSKVMRRPFSPIHNPLANLPKVRIDGQPIREHACLWMSHTSMNIRVYLTARQEFDFSRDAQFLIWEATNVMLLPNEQNNRDTMLNLTLSSRILQEGTAVAHIFVYHDRLISLDPSHESYDPQLITYRQLPMTKVVQVKKVTKVVSLLGNQEETDEVEEKIGIESQDKVEEEILLPLASLLDNPNQNFFQKLGDDKDEEEDEEIWKVLWKPTLSIRMVSQFSTYPLNGIPTSMAKFMSFDYETGFYYPIVYLEEFWLMEKNMIELNETSAQIVPLHISYSEITTWRWQVQTQMEQQWEAQENMGIARSGEIDGIRQLLIDTDPRLLVLTVTVSLLHTLFNFLAFSNDVKFYRQIKDFSGISLRSMVLNAFFRTIILLYLFDNDTSWVVKMSSGIGLMIEYWKIAKSVNLSSLRSKDNGVATEAASATRAYDKVATDHLLFCVYPLVFGYSIYTLKYSKYKSWYSWVISSLVGFIYMFGFVMMTPQLFINYKLKSVAHLPWRAMIYKSINTFIDDLFAFVIEMPTLHRVACLRDDMIFFIYLYQRWIYPIDKKRTNEFGQEFEEEEEEDAFKVIDSGNTDSSICTPALDVTEANNDMQQLPLVAHTEKPEQQPIPRRPQRINRRKRQRA